MYGIRMSLLPFRLRVDFVDAPSAPMGIWYGMDTGKAPEKWIRAGVLDSTLAVFEGRMKLDSRLVRRAVINGDSVPVLFDARGDLTIDPFASTAYLLGGWHEWLTTERDQHGRIPDDLTLPVQLDAAEVPMVEYWRLVVASMLLERGVDVVQRGFGSYSWAMCATHDVDYIRKWRPGIFWREIVERGLMGQLGESPMKRVGRISGAVRGLFETGDPYRNALVRMQAETVARGGRGTYYFKAAARGSRDVAYDLDDPFVEEELDKMLSAGFEVGLHPAYHSWNHATWLRQEQQALEAAIGRSPASVRTHYLRWQHPQTARLLGEVGFVFDSTLGFSARGGFRHGTCLPFPLFDPAAGEVLPLWEMPLTCMESALFNRQGHSAAGAIDATRPLLRAAERFGGVFVGLWHNTLWDEVDCPGWGEHFLWTLESARTHKAMLSTVSGTLSAWE